jgi:DNA-binding NarL/FixJ family response regulator
MRSIDDPRKRRPVDFTPRQSQIIALAASGLADKEIAAQLHRSLSTIRTHLRRLYRVHGLRNRAEAVAVWMNAPRRQGQRRG